MSFKTVQVYAVNSFFKLFLTDYLASFTSGLVLQCSCGIYPSLVKENFLRDCAAIVLAGLQSRLAKHFFANGGGGVSMSRTVLYIYT